MGKTRNGAIDFLKFMFALLIVVFHFFSNRMNTSVAATALFPLKVPLPGGYIGVEFFFLVSGYLMAQSAQAARNANPPGGTGEESLRFVLRKFTSILPYYLFSIVSSLVLCQAFINYTLITPTVLGLDSLWEMLLLQMSGLGVPQIINGPVWYLSAMLIAMLMLYPLLRKAPDLFLNVVAPLAALLLLGHISRVHGTLNVVADTQEWVYPGIQRAIAELCLGCIAFNVCGKLPRFGQAGRWLLGGAELLCYAGTLALANVTFMTHADFVMLLLLAVGVTITFSGQSIFAGLFRGRAFAYLGRLSMALFLCHFSLNRIFLMDVLKIPIVPLFAVYVGCSLALAALCLWAGDGGKRLWARFAARLKANRAQGD